MHGDGSLKTLQIVFFPSYSPIKQTHLKTLTGSLTHDVGTAGMGILGLCRTFQLGCEAALVPTLESETTGVIKDSCQS